jgi:hypothetical protein
MDWRLEQLTLSHNLSIMMCVAIGKLAIGVGNDPRKHRYFNIEKQARIMIRTVYLEIYG